MDKTLWSIFSTLQVLGVFLLSGTVISAPLPLDDPCSGFSDGHELIYANGVISCFNETTTVTIVCALDQDVSYNHNTETWECIDPSEVTTETTTLPSTSPGTPNIPDTPATPGTPTTSGPTTTKRVIVNPCKGLADGTIVAIFINGYIECINGRGRMFVCPPGQILDKKTLKCIIPQQKVTPSQPPMQTDVTTSTQTPSEATTRANFQTTTHDPSTQFSQTTPTIKPTQTAQTTPVITTPASTPRPLSDPCSGLPDGHELVYANGVINCINETTTVTIVCSLEQMVSYNRITDTWICTDSSQNETETTTLPSTSPGSPNSPDTPATPGTPTTSGPTTTKRVIVNPCKGLADGTIIAIFINGYIECIKGRGRMFVCPPGQILDKKTLKCIIPQPKVTPSQPPTQTDVTTSTQAPSEASTSINPQTATGHQSTLFSSTTPTVKTTQIALFSQHTRGTGTTIATQTTTEDQTSTATPPTTFDRTTTHIQTTTEAESNAEGDKMSTDIPTSPDSPTTTSVQTTPSIAQTTSYAQTTMMTQTTTCVQTTQAVSEMSTTPHSTTSGSTTTSAPRPRKDACEGKADGTILSYFANGYWYCLYGTPQIVICPKGKIFDGIKEDCTDGGDKTIESTSTTPDPADGSPTTLDSTTTEDLTSTTPSSTTENAPTRRDCYGDLDKIKPTGKSKGGVKASQNDAKLNNPHIKKYKKCIDKVADKYCIQASLIAAIISRESNGGTTLDKNGYGDNGRGYGLMQCDTKSSGLNCLKCAWNSCCHIDMMTEFFVKQIKDVQGKHKKWTKEQALQGGLVAYNSGLGNVRSLARLDVGTTNNDYSNDVLARAQWFDANGWD